MLILRYYENIDLSSAKRPIGLWQLPLWKGNFEVTFTQLSL